MIFNINCPPTCSPSRVFSGWETRINKCWPNCTTNKVAPHHIVITRPLPSLRQSKPMVCFTYKESMLQSNTW